MEKFDRRNYPPRKFTLSNLDELCHLGYHHPQIEYDIREIFVNGRSMPIQFVGQETITCSHCEAWLDRAYTCHAGLHAYRTITHPTQWISTGGSAYPIRFPDKHVCEFCGDIKK